MVKAILSERNGEPGMCNPLLIPALGRLILKGYHEFKTRPATQWDLVSKKTQNQTNKKTTTQPNNQKSKQNKCRNCTRPGAVRPFSSALERWRQSQVDHRELQASQGYILRPCLEKTTKTKPTKTIKNPNPQNSHNSLKPPVGQSLKDNSRRLIKSNGLVSW